MVFIAIIKQAELAFGLLMFLAITTVAYTAAFKSITPSVFTIVFFAIHCGMFQLANIGMLVQVGEGIMYIPYALLFILLQYAYRIERMSLEERQVKEQIKGLRRYIKDYSYLSNKDDIQEIVLWEDYFILAIALGLNICAADYIAKGDWTRGFAFDYSLPLGKWISIEANPWRETVISMAKAIEQASKVMTIRQGDLIAIDCNTASHRLDSEEVIQVEQNEEELLYCKIK
jgi:hypothetical protein